jgi:hypothetical protein
MRVNVLGTRRHDRGLVTGAEGAGRHAIDRVTVPDVDAFEAEGRAPQAVSVERIA